MNALATQPLFLIQRVRQLEDIRQSDLFATVRVGDFMIEKERLFAELALYRQVYERIAGEAVAPVDVLLGRIAERAIPYEAFMDPRYLEHVASAYTRFFHHYEGAPHVIVNAAEIDLRLRRRRLRAPVRQGALDLQGPGLPESAAALNARVSHRASRDCIIATDAPPALAN